MHKTWVLAAPVIIRQQELLLLAYSPRRIDFRMIAGSGYIVRLFPREKVQTFNAFGKAHSKSSSFVQIREGQVFLVLI